MDTTHVTFGPSSHDIREFEDPRPLKDWEIDVLDRVLRIPFEGRDNALLQVRSARVEAECLHCPTVWLTVDTLSSEVITKGGRPLVGILPCELEGRDADGMPISILIHVREGYVYELEVFRVDGNPLLALPHARTLRTICE